MKGLTNAISQSGGGGGGDTISAVNRTNAIIREGDKVWLNKNSVVPNSKYNWTDLSYYSATSAAISDSTCQVGLCGNNQVYSLKDSSAELLVTQSTDINAQALYLEDGTVLYGGTSGVFTLTADSLVTKINGNRSIRFFSNLYDAHRTKVSLWDIKNGVTSKTWTYERLDNTFFIYNGYVYGQDEFNNYITAKLNDDGTMTDMAYSHGLRSYYAFGYTSDLKYIFCSEVGNSLNFDIAAKSVYRAEPFGDMLKFTKLQDGDLPTKLQAIINSCCLAFNPMTNILSVANETEYLFYKYENEELVELAIDLGIGDLLSDGYAITNCPFINSDLSRAVIGLYKDSRFYPYTCLIQKTSDYNLVAYKSYMITADTLTGKANQDIPSGGTGEVTTVLVD